MDEENFAGKARKEIGLFAGAVAAADHADRHIAIERAVAGGAGGEAVADEFLFPGQAEVAWCGAGGNDEGSGFKGFRTCFEQEATVAAALDRFNAGISDARAKFFRLGLHFHHQLWAHDAFGVTWKIFHFGGGGELTAGLGAGKEKRTQVSACGVDRCGVARATGADNDDVFHGFENL